MEQTCSHDQQQRWCSGHRLQKNRRTLLFVGLILAGLFLQPTQAAKARDRSKSGRWRCACVSVSIAFCCKRCHVPDRCSPTNEPRTQVCVTSIKCCSNSTQWSLACCYTCAVLSGAHHRHQPHQEPICLRRQAQHALKMASCSARGWPAQEISSGAG